MLFAICRSSGEQPTDFVFHMDENARICPLRAISVLTVGAGLHIPCRLSKHRVLSRGASPSLPPPHANMRYARTRPGGRVVLLPSYLRARRLRLTSRNGKTRGRGCSNRNTSESASWGGRAGRPTITLQVSWGHALGPFYALVLSWTDSSRLARTCLDRGTVLWR